MSRFIDLTGQRFTRLLVLAQMPRESDRTRWRCRCDCGKELIVYSNNLRSGKSKSCGCYTGDLLRELRRTHDMSGTPEYRCWQAMHKRCSNPKDKLYHRYGARGIAVCERWSDFANFYADMGPRPSPKLTIERVNNDGNYEPDNCKWATRLEQSYNKSNTWYVTYKGQRMPLIQAVHMANSGANYFCVKARLYKGWVLEEALETPPNHTGWRTRRKNADS